MKKKILFLSPLPPPHYGSAISSESCLEILRKDKNLEVKNIKLNYSKSMSDVGLLNFDKIKGFFKVRSEIRDVIDKFNPELVYFVPATSSLGLLRDYLFIKQIRKFNKKIIFHIRSRMSDNDWENPVYSNIYRKMFIKEDQAIMLGESLVSDIKNLIPKNNLFILTNAIQNEVSDKELKKAMAFRKKGFKILFLSNMDESKGWFKLLQACRLLKQKNVDFECNFVGEWPGKKEEMKFFEFIGKNDLNERIYYLGKKTGKEKKNILATSNVMVFPTEYKFETFGRVIVEGMMFGLPVIANGIATIPSIVNDGKTGFLLKKNAPEEIAHKLELLIKNRKLSEQMGKNGRKRFIEKFEMTEYSKKFCKIIERV